MSVQIQCPVCKRTYDVEPDKIGPRARCRCGAVLDTSEAEITPLESMTKTSYLTQVVDGSEGAAILLGIVLLCGAFIMVVADPHDKPLMWAYAGPPWAWILGTVSFFCAAFVLKRISHLEARLYELSRRADRAEAQDRPKGGRDGGLAP